MPTTPIVDVVRPSAAIVSRRIRMATGSPQPGHRSCSPVCSSDGVFSPTGCMTGSSTFIGPPSAAPLNEARAFHWFARFARSRPYLFLGDGILDARGDDLDVEQGA